MLLWKVVSEDSFKVAEVGKKINYKAIEWLDTITYFATFLWERITPSQNYFLKFIFAIFRHLPIVHDMELTGKQEMNTGRSRLW